MVDPKKGVTNRGGEYQLEITANPGLSNILMTRTDGTTPSKIATLDTKLKDIDQFWDNSGLCLLNNPQPVTLLQGDGKQAVVYLFGDDTLQQTIDKFNDAIANQLGQKAYVASDDLDQFVSFVSSPDSTGTETVAGTLVFRTAIAGRTGEIRLASGEAIINAFGLSEIQGSTRTQFTVNVKDVNGNTIVNNITITDNILSGIIHPNIDNNLGVAGENLTASESRIRDTDIAGEMMEYVKFQTLTQSSQVMLAQANQQPESVLSLLRS